MVEWTISNFRSTVSSQGVPILRVNTVSKTVDNKIYQSLSLKSFLSRAIGKTLHLPENVLSENLSSKLLLPTPENKQKIPRPCPEVIKLFSCSTQLSKLSWVEHENCFKFLVFLFLWPSEISCSVELNMKKFYNLGTLSSIYSTREEGTSGIFFLFLQENIYCGYSLEVPQWDMSNDYP